MTPQLYSESNVLNSLSSFLAGQLLADGYLLYYQRRDVLQTGAGWYPEWSVHRATYLADASFAAALAAARGVLTLTAEIPAEPRFITRLISDASVGAPDEVTVPTLSIEVGPPIVTGNYELGTRTKYRSRFLLCDGFVRTVEEQRRLADALARWFDPETTLDVLDHDAGTLVPVGPLTVDDTVVRTQVWPQRAEVATYEVLLTARLIYVA